MNRKVVVRFCSVRYGQFTGVKVVFGMHFVKTNIVSRDINDLYSKLFALRMTGDYDDTYNLREEDVLPLIEPTEALITTIAALAQEKIRNKFVTYATVTYRR